MEKVQLLSIDIVMLIVKSYLKDHHMYTQFRLYKIIEQCNDLMKIWYSSFLAAF